MLSLNIIIELSRNGDFNAITSTAVQNNLIKTCKCASFSLLCTAVDVLA